jgi:hypothetical protein
VCTHTLLRQWARVGGGGWDGRRRRRRRGGCFFFSFFKVWLLILVLPL